MDQESSAAAREEFPEYPLIESLADAFAEGVKHQMLTVVAAHEEEIVSVYCYRPYGYLPVKSEKREIFISGEKVEIRKLDPNVKARIQVDFLPSLRENFSHLKFLIESSEFLYLIKLSR